MKKSSIRISFLLPLIMFLCILSSVVTYAGYSLEQLRIANVLINEAGGLGEKSMRYIAEVLRNQYRAQNAGYNRSNITYSDLMFHSWKPGGDSAFEHARDKFAYKSKQELESFGSKRGGKYWGIALQLADDLLKGNLKSNLVGGANAFHGCKYESMSECQKHSKYTITAFDKTPAGFNNHMFYSWDMGKYKHAYDADTVAQPGPDYGYSASQGATAGAETDGSRSAANCAMDVMQAMYLTEGNVDNACWYCKIVIVLVNAYLKVANDALNSATLPLAKIILKLGFLIWLAYYILQQVSSVNPVAPGKMMQEILVMGFKVSLAYFGLGMGTQLIRDYYLNPIVGTGVDYGLAIFDNMNGTAIFKMIKSTAGG